jgi:hypothetical protein
MKQNRYLAALNLNWRQFGGSDLVALEKKSCHACDFSRLMVQESGLHMSCKAICATLLGLLP